MWSLHIYLLKISNRIMYLFIILSSNFCKKIFSIVSLLQRIFQYCELKWTLYSKFRGYHSIYLLVRNFIVQRIHAWIHFSEVVSRKEFVRSNISWELLFVRCATSGRNWWYYGKLANSCSRYDTRKSNFYMSFTCGISLCTTMPPSLEKMCKTLPTDTRMSVKGENMAWSDLVHIVMLRRIHLLRVAEVIVWIRMFYCYKII